jgi:hypothetical protein
MELDYDLLWDKSNPIHVATYRKRIFDPTKNGDNPRELAKSTGELFDFNQGYRLTGALSVYAQIDSDRNVADVDICVDENKILEVVQVGIDKDYSFCRLAQRELREGIRTCVFEEIPTEQFLQRKPSVRAVLLNRSVQEKYKPLDIVDVFVGYTDKQGWESTYDHRLSPIIPNTIPTEAKLEYGGGNVRTVSLEYMAAVKAILIEDEAIFGAGNKIDREKNEFDLENILRNLKADFSDKLKEVLKERRKRLTE